MVFPEEAGQTLEGKLMGGPKFPGKCLTVNRFSPATSKLGDDIRSGRVDPVVHLRRQLDQGDTDFETMNTCLWGYRMFRLAGMDREQRANLLAGDQLGSLSLVWLWKDEKRWATILERDFKFIPTLCFFVAAEQKHEYLLETLRLNMLSDKTFPYWRGKVFQNVIWGLLKTVGRPNADQALQVFFRVDNEITVESAKRAAGQDDVSPIAMTSPTGAIIMILRSLITADYSDTSPQLWRKFVRLCEQRLDKVIKDPDACRWNMALLALSCPGSPDPDPLMRIFRKAAGQSSMEVFRKSRDGTRALVYHKLNDLESVLSLQGRREDSEWASKLRASLYNEDEAKRFSHHQAAERPLHSSRTRTHSSTSSFRKTPSSPLAYARIRIRKLTN